MAIRVQLLAGIGLLALIPVVVFLLTHGEIVAFAVLNTLLIVASIYYMFSPADVDHEHHPA